MNTIETLLLKFIGEDEREDTVTDSGIGYSQSAFARLKLRKELRAKLPQVVQAIEEEIAKTYGHNTEDGWCCACEADLAFAESQLRESKPEIFKDTALLPKPDIREEIMGDLADDYKHQQLRESLPYIDWKPRGYGKRNHPPAPATNEPVDAIDLRNYIADKIGGSTADEVMKVVRPFLAISNLEARRTELHSFLSGYTSLETARDAKLMYVHRRIKHLTTEIEALRGKN